jgi:hypothetical protein
MFIFDIWLMSGIANAVPRPADDGPVRALDADDLFADDLRAAAACFEAFLVAIWAFL